MRVSRYELKYLISESKAEAIGQMLAMYVAPDVYSRAAGPHGYTIHSLYLDSPDLILYRQTRAGLKHRFKLRMRFYEDFYRSQKVFLEIKRRVNDVIGKERIAVRPEAADTILRGGHVSVAALLEQDLNGISALRQFCRLRDHIGAIGCVFVCYQRRAFECRHGRPHRVTLDRFIVGHRYEAWRGIEVPTPGFPTKVHGVVLEFKYTGDVPRWMVDLAHRFDLQRVSVPKYIECANVVLPECRGVLT